MCKHDDPDCFNCTHEDCIATDEDIKRQCMRHKKNGRYAGIRIKPDAWICQIRIR